MTKLIINSIPKSGGHLFQHLAKTLGFTEYKSGIVYLSSQFIISHFKLFFILLNMKPKQFVSAHFFHTRSAELILNFFNVKMILVERDFFDVLQSQIDFLKSTQHPYHLLFKDLSDLDVAKILMSGYSKPIECVNPKNGKRFLEKDHGIKEPIDIVFKKIAKWKNVKGTINLNYTNIVNDADADIFGIEIMDFMKILSDENVYPTNKVMRRLYDNVYLKPTATLFVGGNNRGKELRKILKK